MEELKPGLEDVKLYKENNKYYFDLRYIVIEDGAYYRIRFPKVKVLFNNNAPTVYSESSIFDFGDSYTSTLQLFSNDRFYIYPDRTGVKVIKIFIKNIRKKMTLEEIEKELGYEVELIDE